MSKFGLVIGDDTVYSIKTPDKALSLVEEVVSQFFGELWTQHKPQCPLCNAGLNDTERHMNRPVGECSSEKCGSTIHVADFMGKIKDILTEWGMSKDDWMKEVQAEMRKKVEEAQRQKELSVGSQHFAIGSKKSAAASETTSGAATNTGKVEFVDDIDKIDANTVFVW